MKNLFLEGSPGIGKSFTILDTLGRAIAYAGGYFTVRMRYGNGMCAGFRVRAAQETVSPDEVYSEDKPGVFMTFTTEGKKKSDTVFLSFASSYLRCAWRFPYVLIDEFGGFEITNDSFLEQLKGVIASEQPCIGVIKSKKNAELLSDNIILSPIYRENYRELREYLEDREDTLIVNVDETGREETKRLIDQWLCENEVGIL